MKKVLNWIWNEFIYGGHLTALGAPGIAYMTSVLLGKEINWAFVILLYTGAQSVYLFDRLKDVRFDARANERRSAFLQKKIKFYYVAVVFYFIATCLIPLLNHKVLFEIVFLSVFALSLAYSKLFKPITKKIVGFKSIFVSIVWSLIPVFYVFYFNLPFTFGLLLIIAFMLMREWVNTWFCDIKDIEIDKEHGLKTFAGMFSGKVFSFILIIINLISVVPIIFGIIYGLIPPISYFLLFSVVYALCYLAISKYNRINQELMFSIIPDTEPVLYAVFLIVGRGLGF